MKKLLAATLMCCALVVGTAGADSIPDPEAEGLGPGERIQALIDRIKLEQSRLETMEADFRQRKESQLLLEPEEAEGHFSYQAPDKVIWEFEAPIRTLVVIRGEEMLTWYRELERAERINVGRQADRVLQYLSASNSLETLQNYFTLKAVFPEDPEAPYRIDLEPRFSRVARRIAGMTIWLDRTLYVPSQLRIEEPDGDLTEYEFSGFSVNEEIPPERFEPEIPESVEVTELELSSG